MAEFRDSTLDNQITQIELPWPSDAFLMDLPTQLGSVENMMMENLIPRIQERPESEKVLHRGIPDSTVDALLLDSHTFRATRDENGKLYLQTLHRDRDGLRFGIQVHSDRHLSACVPRKSALSLLRRFPERFTIRQNAEDTIVLLFERSRLKELADVLRLKRKRRVSASERGRLMRMILRFSPSINGGGYVNLHRRESAERDK